VTATTIDQLSAALNAAAPTLDADDRSLARALYRALATGEPATEGTLATTVDRSTNDVRATLASWPGVYRDDADRIIGFWGLSLVEMPHTLNINGTQLFAWCAWDTLFLPAVLDATARIESRDPHNGHTVRLTVDSDRVTDRSYPGMVVSFVLPEAPLAGDVIADFCHYVHFFTDGRSASAWTAAHDGTFAVDLDDAFELGRRWNAARGL
jgi:alkylmercury lyase